jgi:hypothetical protein
MGNICGALKWGVGVVESGCGLGGIIVRIKHIDWTGLPAHRFNLQQRHLQNSK